MKFIFIFLAVAYLLLFIIRWLLSFTYYKRGQAHIADFPEEFFTVVQPILSGDPRLESDLRANLQQTEAVEFYWLIDQSDTEAQRVADQICQEASLPNAFESFSLKMSLKGLIPRVTRLSRL